MTRQHTRRAGSSTALALLLGAASTSGAAASVPTLFHSPTGTDPGALVLPLPPNQSHTLYLYLAPGGVVTSNGGAICNAGSGGLGGNGDETCGVYLEVSVDGDLSITSFTPQVGQATSKIEASGGKRLRAAVVTTASPLPATPTLVGTLVLNSGPTGGTVQLAKLDTVDADLDLRSGAPRAIAYVPEPSGLLQLAAGGGALALLSGWRRRRGGIR